MSYSKPKKGGSRVRARSQSSLSGSTAASWPSVTPLTSTINTNASTSTPSQQTIIIGPQALIPPPPLTPSQEYVKMMSKQDKPDKPGVPLSSSSSPTMISTGRSQTDPSSQQPSPSLPHRMTSSPVNASGASPLKTSPSQSQFVPSNISTQQPKSLSQNNNTAQLPYHSSVTVGLAPPNDSNIPPVPPIPIQFLNHPPRPASTPLSSPTPITATTSMHQPSQFPTTPSIPPPPPRTTLSLQTGGSSNAAVPLSQHRAQVAPPPGTMMIMMPFSNTSHGHHHVYPHQHPYSQEYFPKYSPSTATTPASTTATTPTTSMIASPPPTLTQLQQQQQQWQSPSPYSPNTFYFPREKTSLDGGQGLPASPLDAAAQPFTLSTSPAGHVPSGGAGGAGASTKPATNLIRKLSGRRGGGGSGTKSKEQAETVVAGMNELSTVAVLRQQQPTIFVPPAAAATVMEVPQGGVQSLFAPPRTSSNLSSKSQGGFERKMASPTLVGTSKSMENLRNLLIKYAEPLTTPAVPGIPTSNYPRSSGEQEPLQSGSNNQSIAAPNPIATFHHPHSLSYTNTYAITTSIWTPTTPAIPAAPATAPIMSPQQQESSCKPALMYQSVGAGSITPPRQSSSSQEDERPVAATTQQSESPKKIFGLFRRPSQNGKGRSRSSGRHRALISQDGLFFPPTAGAATATAAAAIDGERRLFDVPTLSSSSFSTPFVATSNSNMQYYERGRSSMDTTVVVIQHR